MLRDVERQPGAIGSEVIPRQEGPVFRRERWEEIHRRWVEEWVPIAEIPRRVELDRTTVRRCLRAMA